MTCSLAVHGAAILQILNHEIVNSTALYDVQPRHPDSMADWFASREVHACPTLGLESDQGELLGFASYAPFRPHAAYSHTMEHSIYVHPNHRNQGLGRQLLHALVAHAEQQSVHVLIGVIDATNAASIALHKALGFRHVGTLPEVGFKFGRWLDVCLYQRLLG